MVRAFEIPEEKRTVQEANLAEPLVKVYDEIKIEEFLTDKERELERELAQQLVKLVLEVPLEDDSHRVQYDGVFDVPSATVLGHVETELIPETYILDRGDLGRNKSKVDPGVPGILHDGSDSEMQMEPGGARYRKQLALWLTRADHPLTARVMVNRIWQGHFGRGIVGTTNDSGRQGQLPTHPELLVWLAAEFVAQGWSIKSTHRLILLSNTYQMASRFVDEKNRSVDPENVYLWRMRRRRLEAEAIWDSIHAVAGTLNLKMDGRPVMPPLAKSELTALRVQDWWIPSAGPEEANRRAVYVLSRRDFMFPMFDKCDRPNPSLSCPRRDVTNVAPQMLWTLNNQISYTQAEQFAARLVREHGDNRSAWVDAAWHLALGREPSSTEQQEAIGLLARLSRQSGENPEMYSTPQELARLGSARVDGLTQLCLAIFNLNEFVYID